MKDLVRRLQPDDFEEIIALVGTQANRAKQRIAGVADDGGVFVDGEAKNAEERF